MIFEGLIYNINYNIAALLLLVVIIICDRKIKMIKITVYRVFFILVWIHIISCAVDISTAFIISYPHDLPLWILYLVGTLDYLSLNLTVPVFLVYMLITFNISYRNNKGLYFLSMLPTAANALMIISNPFTKYIFYFNENREYSYGPCINISYAISALTLVIGFIIIIRNKYKIAGYKRMSLYSFFLCLGAALAYQQMAPHVMFQMICEALGLVIVSLSFQSPEEVLDSSTGAYNRTSFFDRVSLDYETEDMFYIFCIYYDDVKTIDSAFTYTQIRELDSKIVKYFIDSFRNIWVCKIRDGCFSIKADIRSEKEAKELMAIIMQRFKSSWFIDNISISIPVSIFCICCPSDAPDISGLIEQMNSYHPSGRREIKFAVDMEKKSYERKALILGIIRKAIENDAINVYYQPIYSIKKKKINSAEALIRISDNEHGSISPEEFIPIAEKEGLILALSDVIFNKVCQFISSINMDELGLDYIEVNLSVVQCMQQQLIEKMFSVLDSYHIPAKYINLEVTETEAANYPDILIGNMSALKEKGLSFSLDDYGTGYSNVVFTYRLPFDYVKIDKGILWSAFKNEKAFITLKHTIAMIKKLNMKIIVEGVETASHVQELEKLGCDYLQGYYFSKALPENGFVEFVRDYAPDI